MENAYFFKVLYHNKHMLVLVIAQSRAMVLGSKNIP